MLRSVLRPLRSFASVSCFPAPAMPSHLKEQDELFQFILHSIKQQGVMSPEKYDTVFGSVEDMIAEHIEAPEGSALSKAVPSLKEVHMPLPLRKALAEYDAHTRVRQRKHVPMAFKEVRHIANIATVNCLAPRLRLLCLDADETCYSDGGTITADSPMIPLITAFIRAGITVCLVTAAGYANAPDKYEHRLAGLLAAFQFAVDMGAPPAAFQKHFYVMGGEANYLHRLSIVSGRLRLAVVPGEEWKAGRGVRWSLEGINDLLNIAEATLRERATALGLHVQFIRKERAIGMIRAGDAKFPFEVLEEVALAVQEALAGHPVPHCAFNGGQDCWVDVGNKALGIRAVQSFLSPQADACCTVHVGDRFTTTGNDTHAREVAHTLWIANPRETNFFLRLLIRAVRRARAGAVAAGEGGDVPPPLPPVRVSAAAVKAGVGGWVSTPESRVDVPTGQGQYQHAAAALGVSSGTAPPAAAGGAGDGDEDGSLRADIPPRPFTPERIAPGEGEGGVSPLVQSIPGRGEGLPPLALPLAAPSASKVRSALEADGGQVVGQVHGHRGSIVSDDGEEDDQAWLE